ncbi:helix-turn-helix domain-containing protein [Burkholderia multivorans]|uniref:helix-turn-helix domain-containing protein n=1 Tax=Burkholderia multivorans TaxID=87883 RepID=UPI0006A62B7E|nr:helix-turn-helix transcriptional regulator [Burkholderia multivorans]
MSSPEQQRVIDVASSKKEELVNKKIGKIIAKRRVAAGFTQEEAAERLGIGSEAFSRIERGLNAASTFKLYELADMFKCGVETFLIEGSRRPSDQAEHVETLLSKLSASDRSLVVSIVERLARRLTGSGKTKEGKSESEMTLADHLSK